MSAPHTIKGHAAMSAQELELSPEIISRHDLRPLSNDDRYDAYRAKLRHALKSGHGVTCEAVKRPEAYPLIAIPEGRTEMTNISRMLRKGGAK